MSDKLTILVVDDVEDMREIISVFLERAGYEVLTAHSGNAALEIFTREHIDLIVSDIMMEDGNGWDLVAGARNMNPDIPVIFITGYEIEKARNKAETVNVDGFLSKPFRNRILVEMVREVLERKQR